MRQQTLLLRFEPQATPPSDDPPAFDVTSGPGTVTLLDGDDTDVPTGARYTTHITMTGEDTFEESGELTFDGGSLKLSTAVPGLLHESARPGTVMGAVTWLVEGTGRYEGATGMVSSNFEFRMGDGSASEQQVARIFLP